MAQGEIFGPVIAVLAHGGGGAVAIASNSRYVLSGMVVSADPKRARAAAGRIRTGTISINGGISYGADVPVGGYRQSGVGGFEEYLEIMAIAEGIRG